MLKQRWSQLSSRQWVSSTAFCPTEDTPGGREKAPLHPEWEGMARKVMKGADPAETLTWRTPEVKGCGWRVKRGVA